MKPLKFIHTNDSKVFFWGCTHVFHNKEFIWKARGYSSILEHAKAIKDKINLTCRREDCLILLGDGFLNSSINDVRDFLFSLNTHIYYIWGNHESSTTRFYFEELNNCGYKDIEVYPFTIKNVTFWGFYKTIEINKKTLILQHFPLQIFDYQKYGSFHIHSHEHGKLKTSLPEYKDGLYLDVGVDVFPEKPVSFDDILWIMSHKKIISADNHH